MSFMKPVLLQDGRLTLAPVGHCTWVVQALLNGSSKNMATIATAPSTFSFTPAAGTTCYLTALSIAFTTSGTPDPTDFGNIPALTNGIDIDIRTGGITTTAINIKDNFDLALTFFESTNVGGAAGFLNDADLYTGSVRFDAPIMLQNSTADFIRAVVKSPTTGSGSDLRIYAHLYKQL